MYPSGLDVDSSGNVVVADTGNDQVDFFLAGSTTPLWVKGDRGASIGAGADNFSNPRDVAVDANYVYVADTDNQIVQVLNKSDGSYVGQFAQKFNSAIGIKVGSDGAGHERILVADGGPGNVYLYDTSFNLVMTLPGNSATEGTRGAATDSLGNIYTADYRGNRVDKYSPTGTLLLQWGGTGAPTCQQIPKPYGVVVDSTDHVYVASSDLEVIKEFNPDGSCVGTFGTKGSGSMTKLFQLRRVAVGPGPNPMVYAADLWGLKVLTYNHDGTLSTAQPALGDGTYPSPGGLNESHGVAVTSTNVFVIDTVNQRMQRFNLDGSGAFPWGTKGVIESTASFNWAQGVGYDPVSGNIWVANTRNNRIDEFAPDGTSLRTLGQRVGPGPAMFNWPMAVTFDPAGNMYVADTFNNRIQSYSVPSTGTPTLRWVIGTKGTGTGYFSHPFGLAYDATLGRVLVTDTNNNRVVSLDATTGGWLAVLPITRGTGNGKVKGPQGITVTPTGAIWVADTGNNRIEKFNADGTFANELVGSLGTSNTQFNAPQGMVIGPDGLLYVADAFNSRIQVFQP